MPTRTYEYPIDPQLSAELLVGLTSTPRAVSSYADAVRVFEEYKARAEEYLRTSTLARIVAEHEAKKHGRNGDPRIIVADGGSLVLEVNYKSKRKGKTKRNKSNLPYMDELRERAERLGVDISDLGRKRRAIFERLNDHEFGTEESGEVVEDPEEEIETEEPQPEPEESEANFYVDEEGQLQSVRAKHKRRRVNLTLSASQKKAPPKLNLERILAEAEGSELDDLLGDEQGVEMDMDPSASRRRRKVTVEEDDLDGLDF